MKNEFPRAYDSFGKTALFKFPRGLKLAEKKRFARVFLSENSSFSTILEKIDKIKGRLRKQATNYLAGEKTKEILYYENNCVFRFNIDGTYFSPRLSNERKELSTLIKGKKKVLVMFGGIAPYAVVIAKKCKSCDVTSVEVNRAASKYAKLNVQLNKLKNIEIVQGDVKKVMPCFVKTKIKFDVIVMPRPKLKESFLKEAFSVAKKGTIVYYYDFCAEDMIGSVVKKVQDEAAKCKKKIKILNFKKAGDIGPHYLRVRIDFQII